MSRDEAVGLIDDAIDDLGTRHVDAVAALLQDAELFDNPRQAALDVLAAVDRMDCVVQVCARLSLHHLEVIADALDGNRLRHRFQAFLRCETWCSAGLPRRG